MRFTRHFELFHFLTFVSSQPVVTLFRDDSWLLMEPWVYLYPVGGSQEVRLLASRVTLAGDRRTHKKMAAVIVALADQS